MSVCSVLAFLLSGDRQPQPDSLTRSTCVPRTWPAGLTAMEYRLGQLLLSLCFHSELSAAKVNMSGTDVIVLNCAL